MQAPATNLDPKPIKVLSTLDYVLSTGPASLVESGRKPDSGLNHSLVGSGKYLHGRPQHRRPSVRMPRVDKALPTARAKRIVAAISAAIKVPRSTPPTSPAHRLLQSPYLPDRLKYLGHGRPGMFDASMYSILLPVLKHSVEFRGGHP